MRTTWLLGGLVFPVIAYVGCGSSGSSTTNPTDDGGTDAPNISDAGADVSSVTGGQTLSITAPGTVTISPGATVNVTITRAGDLGEPIALTLDGLPPGVSGGGNGILAQAMSGTVTLIAAPSAAPIAMPTTITVHAKGATLTATATFALALHGAPGTLDSSWGTKGISAGIGANGTQATGIAFQKSGQVVIGGYDNFDFAVARYTTAGALDTTFGTQGFTIETITGSAAPPTCAGALLTDANDRIIQAGSALPSDGQVIRYTSAGVADGAFGTSGVATITHGQNLYGLSFDATGNILAGGFDSIHAGRTYRVTPTGTYDTTFGGGTGYAETPEGMNHCVPSALALQSTGRIIAVGTCQNITNVPQDGFVAAITTAGVLDTTFGATAGFTNDASNYWLAVAVAKDDSVYFAGKSTDAITKFSVSKVSKAGVLDTTFNGTGVSSQALGDASQPSQANGIAIQSDGKIVVVGEAVANGRSVMAVVRFTANGALDSTFGPNGGIVTIPVATATAAANAVAIAPDGRIYVAGHGDMDFAVARLWP